MSNKDDKKQPPKDDQNQKNEPRPCPRCGEPGCYPGKCIKPRPPGAS